MVTRLSKFRAVTVLRMRLIERHTLQECADHLGIGLPAVHAWERRLVDIYGKRTCIVWTDIEKMLTESWDPAWSWPEFVEKEVDRVG